MSGEWENYWTAGYTVKGSAPVIVERYCRQRPEAEKKATAAARVDLAALNELGIEHTIDVWTQHWRTRRVEEVDVAESIEILTSTRRTQAVERTHKAEATS